ncbi:hypothetical protein ABZ215_18095 [Amycolatopsis sp. NPDC006131]|uniref:hypothetical protein n=1 Tax=Amycolatopsis sp. NPDC006131 TaxID=3156731 RepID=UPI0033B207E9
MIRPRSPRRSATGFSEYRGERSLTPARRAGSPITVFTRDGHQPTLANFAANARNAIDAGFAGVEVHAAGADLVSLGRTFPANPDLVTRLRLAHC